MEVTMIAYCVSVSVKHGYENSFIKATNLNRKETLKEKGNLRFDILQNEKESNQFMLYEVYRSEEAVMAHKETYHYKNWREKVAPCMARDRRGEKFLVVHPKEDKDW